MENKCGSLIFISIVILQNTQLRCLRNLFFGTLPPKTNNNREQYCFESATIGSDTGLGSSARGPLSKTIRHIENRFYLNFQLKRLVGQRKDLNWYVLPGRAEMFHTFAVICNHDKKFGRLSNDLLLGETASTT